MRPQCTPCGFVTIWLQEVSRGTLILTNRRMLQSLWAGKLEPFEPRGITGLELWSGGIRLVPVARDRLFEVPEVTAPWLYLALSYLVLGNRHAALNLPLDYPARAQAERRQLPT
jgi:hypothetical protein